jgi:prepilin-type N-terminal cleavage/methylation domain-containing protein
MVLTFYSKKAFTLVELLVVIAIVGLLSTIVLAVTSGVSNQGRIAKNLQFSKHLENSLGDYLVGRWNLDEGIDNTCSDGKDACDSSGWNNNGTFVNSPVWKCANIDKDYAPSGNGCSLELNGSNQYVDCGNNSSLNITNVITVEAWVKPAVSPQNLLAGIYAGNYQAKLTVTPNSPYNKFSFRVYVGTDYYANGITSFDANKWYHVVGTYNGTDIKLYVDGSLDAVTPRTGTLSSLTGNYFIGRDEGGAARYFSGLIDEVRVYNRALTSAQIKSQYYADLNRLLTKGLINEKECQSKLIKA